LIRPQFIDVVVCSSETWNNDLVVKNLVDKILLEMASDWVADADLMNCFDASNSSAERNSIPIFPKSAFHAYRTQFTSEYRVIVAGQT